MFGDPSFLRNHSEHFILHNSEFITVGCSAESAVTLLIFGDLIRSFSVVSEWEIGVGIAVVVALIGDNEIMAKSECWTATWIPFNQLISILGNVLLFEIQRQQKRILPFVVNIFIFRVPCVLSEGSDGFVELCPYNGKGVSYTIALLMEGLSTELVL